MITAVSCPVPLKERLRSLGIRADGMVRLLKVSFFKKTYLVQAGSSQIALRREVAERIEVQRT